MSALAEQITQSRAYAAAVGTSPCPECLGAGGTTDCSCVSGNPECGHGSRCEGCDGAGVLYRCAGGACDATLTAADLDARGWCIACRSACLRCDRPLGEHTAEEFDACDEAIFAEALGQAEQELTERGLVGGAP